MKYYFVFVVFFLFASVSSRSIPSEAPLCAAVNTTISPALLDKFRGSFIKEMAAHYDRLLQSNSTSQTKEEYLKQYENPIIAVCPNPDDISQTAVYIEYEENWWGSLYFATVNKDEILGWNHIHTHGAVVQQIRWKRGDVFYEDSTHGGAKTRNICRILRNSVSCRKLKQG